MQKSMMELREAYGRGAFDPVISHRMPLEKGVEALRLLTERKAVGKVVVEVAPGNEIKK